MEKTQKNQKNEGFILLHRKILKSPIFDDPLMFHLWIYLLFRANWEDKKIFFNGEEITVSRGSFITSINTILKDLKLKPKNSWKIRQRLKTLKNSKKITIKTTNKNTLIIVNNYDKFQSKPQAETQTNHKRATNEPQQINNINNYNKKETFFSLKFLNDFQLKKFEDLEYFVKLKFDKFDDDFILTSLYFFDGSVFDNRFKFEMDLKNDKDKLKNQLKAIKKYNPNEIIKTFANISQKEGLTLEKAIKKLAKTPEKPQNQAQKARQELSKAFNFPF